MVDAAEIVDHDAPRERTSAPASAAGAAPACEVRPFDQRARNDYAAFCQSTPQSTPQNPSFVIGWADEPGTDFVMVTIAEAERTIFMLVLEIVREGPVTIARYPGGRHANGSFPAFAGNGVAEIHALLTGAMRRQRPDVDLVLLERNERERDGRTNPLLKQGCLQSPNVALAVDLDGGFDAVLERSSGKRKRKKHRSQSRKFEAAGGHSRIAGATAEEVDTLLSAFYEMKAARFRQIGVADVFADESIKRAFRRMFVGALDRDQPDFVLHGLEVGGVLRAVTGSSISGNRITCEFSAFRDDELSSASPGDFLFFENISEACDRGLTIYDFGVGDERYKRLWCDIESRHFDLHMPLTAKGQIVSATRRAASAAKRGLKENQAIWSLVKRLRKAGAGKPTPDSDD
ncbi:MAG: GNAT family N-acetyltransferase [Rhizobiaceae bacterium]|nr:GNAT family N-acetyltransferase [Rhizobiaceae bacterium]